MAIKQISEDIRWKIVASSYIIDPSSAVKELIDNSVDANAKTISIDIDSKTGGCEYICVRDDGEGVPVEDREMMCLNHSTSKIRDISDIGMTPKLGFRGEALFLLSTLIHSNGSLEIITRERHEDVAERWLVNKNGSIIPESRKKLPAPVGTTVSIKKLMSGLRARRIELQNKVSRTIKDISNLINHYSISFRDIRFVFSLVSLSRNGSVSNRQLYSSINSKISRVRVLSNMVSLRKSVDLNFWYEDNLVINSLFTTDYILPNMLPEMEIINKKKPFKFVSINHRPLSIKLGLGQMVNKRLNKIYKNFDLLEPHVWYINFNCSGNLIDINIEPEKNNALIANIEDIMNDFEKAITSILERKLNSENEGIHTSYNSKMGSTIQQKQMGKAESNEKGTSGQRTQSSEFVDLDLDPDTTSNVNGNYIKQNQKVNLSRNEVSMDSTTIIIEDQDKDSVVSKNKHMISSDAFVSEGNSSTGGGTWEKLWFDQKEFMPDNSDETKNRSKSQESMSLPSSLTNHYEQATFLDDDDLELSKNISLSNPIIISKLKRLNNSGNVNKQMKQRKVHARGGTNFDSIPQISTKKNIQTNYHFKTDHVCKNSTQHVAKRDVKRHLSLFSEYTNSYLTKCLYLLPRNLDDYEQNWEQKSTDLISSSLTKTLSEIIDLPFNEITNTLKKTEQGWYLLRGPENAK